MNFKLGKAMRPNISSLRFYSVHNKFFGLVQFILKYMLLPKQIYVLSNYNVAKLMIIISHRKNVNDIYTYLLHQGPKVQGQRQEVHVY